MFPTLKNTPELVFAVSFKVSKTLTAVVINVWFLAGPLPFSVKTAIIIAPLALSILEVNVGSFVYPKVTFIRTYSVTLLNGAAVILSKNTGTAGDKFVNAVRIGFSIAALIDW